MRARRWLSAALLWISVGCGGGGGGSSSGAIVDVEPKELIRGRRMTLTVVGDRTSWSSNLGPDDIKIRTRDGQLDPTIAILFVNVANEQYLEIDLEVAPGSLRDRRDLEIAGHNLDGVLRVEPPFEVVQATTIAPGHVITLGIQGRGTDWIPGAVTVAAPQSPELRFDGTLELPYDFALPDVLYTTIPLEATVLRADFLTVTLYAPWYAEAGPIDLEISTPASTDAFPGALEMPALAPTPLVPGTPVSDSLDVPLATNLYTLQVGAFQSCSIEMLNGTPSSELTFLVFNPNEPQIVWAFGGNDDGGYYSYLAFTPQTLVVAVSDLLTLGGGESWDYILDPQCSGYAPAALTEGVPLAAQTLAAADESKYYRIAPSRWTYSTVTITPAVTGAGGPDFSGYIEPFSAFDLPADDYAYADDSGEGEVEIISANYYSSAPVFTSGTREAAVYLSDYYDNVGAASEFTIQWDETPIPGTLYDTADGAQPIPDAEFFEDPQAYVESTIDVTTNVPGTVRVALDIKHAYIGDLVIDVIAPNGKRTRIQDWSVGYGGNDIIAVFPDMYDISSDPPQGYEATLDAAALPSPLGTWTLRVYDAYPILSGVLNGWAITIE